MTPTLPPVADPDFHVGFSRRLQFLTLAIGFSAALVVLFLKSFRAGCGVASGTLLAWLNFRWLDAGLEAFVVAATKQSDSPKTKVPASTYWKFAGRYALIGLIVYVIVSYLSIPLLAVVCGLLALGAAAIVEGLYQVFSGSV